MRGANVRQSIAAKVPAKVGNREVVDLPSRTKQKHPIGWSTSTKRRCVVVAGDLVGKKDGVCKVRAFAAESGRHRALKKRYVVKVR